MVDAIIENNEVSRPGEPTHISGYPNLYYEPGLHEVVGYGFEEKMARLRNGDLQSFVWNREVCKRISQYHPEVVYVDSQPPFYPLRQSGFKTEVYAWFGLPERVRDINSKGIVYLVQGDIIGPEYYVEELDNPDPLKIERVAKQSNEITEAMTVHPVEMTLSGLIVASLWLGKLAASDIRVDRRGFLRLMFAGAALGLSAGITKFFTSLYAQNMSGSSITAEDRSFWTDVSSILQPHIFDFPIGNGRTALAFDKTIDAFQRLFLPNTTPGSILFGPAHNAKATRYLSSEQARTHAISPAKRFHHYSRT